MSELLFLSHRIPYPPDKGDKIRSYHLLRGLAERHTVHLGTFIDDPADWKHVARLRAMCGEVCVRRLDPVRARIRSAAALFSGGALTMSYYHDRVLRRWAADLAKRRPISGVFVFSSSMGQYAAGLPLAAPGVRVIDLCDVDSDKWRQYARGHRFPLKWVYARESVALARVEARYLREFDATLVISAAEARLLPQGGTNGGQEVHILPNGVDIDYFDPSRSFPDPLDPGASAIVFTGAMDYHANVDGVCWFATDIFPSVRERCPQAQFVVVGANPTAEVLALAKLPRVVVTGRVADVRPYLAHARVVVAPLRIARGVQNKVLEALAMNQAVVATDNAVQGIPEYRQAGVAVCTSPATFAEAVVGKLEQPEDSPNGREFVKARYRWDAQLEVLLGSFGAAKNTGGPTVRESGAAAGAAGA